MLDPPKVDYYWRTKQTYGKIFGESEQHNLAQITVSCRELIHANDKKWQVIPISTNEIIHEKLINNINS